VLQAVNDYHQGVVFQLVNRDTNYLLILIVCNNTLGYTDGPDVGYTRRTPELSIRKCAAPATAVPNCLPEPRLENRICPEVVQRISLKVLLCRESTHQTPAARG
jgi:hypothetical protein